MIQFLSAKDREEKNEEGEEELERIMFATNPEWWKHNYVDPAADEKGEIIVTPGTPEEFAAMAADWGLTDQDMEELGL